MSKVIETLCDVCLDKGEKTTAKTIHVEIDGTGPAQLDLCEEHAAQFIQPLLEMVKSLGVTEAGRPVTQPRRRGGGDLRCPDCGKQMKNQGSLNKHVEAQHPETYDSYMKRRGLDPQKCPQCGKTYYGSQAYHMHQARSHKETVATLV